MKSSKLFALFDLVIAFMLFTASCSGTTSVDDDFIPGELLVTIHDDAEYDSPHQLFPYAEIEVLEYFQYVRIVWIGVPEYTEADWIDVLEQDERIRYVNYVRGNVTPRD